jgi:hypothetical protein
MKFKEMPIEKKVLLIFSGCFIYGIVFGALGVLAVKYLEPGWIRLFLKLLGYLAIGMLLAGFHGLFGSWAGYAAKEKGYDYWLAFLAGWFFTMIAVIIYTLLTLVPKASDSDASKSDET